VHGADEPGGHYGMRVPGRGPRTQPEEHRMADMTGYSIVPVDPVEDDGGPEPGGQASGRSVAAAGLEQAATDETLARSMARRPASHPADKNSD
jgi:hypothetical protein